MNDLEWYQNLPKKQLASGALFFNENREFLIVKPLYKDHWLIPGGIVEEWESPKAACKREVCEELGLIVKIDQLLCIDYMLRDTPMKRENIQMIFNGGILSAEQISAINLATEEINGFKFCNLETALQLLSPGLCGRVPKALEALEKNTCFYLEAGEAV